MKIKVTLGVQFMQKDRVTDMPTMHPMTRHDYVMDVTLSPELEPFIDEYAKAVSEPEYNPSYDIGSNLIALIKPRVKKAYPDMWQKVQTEKGFVTLKPTNEAILDAAICLEVDDYIDEFIEDNKNRVLSELDIVPPADDERLYLANVFLRKQSWQLSDDNWKE